MLEPTGVCEDEVSWDAVDETRLGGGPYPPQVEVDDSKAEDKDEVDEDDEDEEEEDEEDEEDVCVSGGG